MQSNLFFTNFSKPDSIGLNATDKTLPNKQKLKLQLIHLKLIQYLYQNKKKWFICLSINIEGEITLLQ